MRQNAKGRQAKSKARLARFDDLSSYEYQRRNETQEIFIPVAERLGDQVIEFQNVSKAYGDRLLIDNLSFQIPPGAIVGNQETYGGQAQGHQQRDQLVAARFHGNVAE